MPKGNWKSLALLGSIAALALVLLIFALLAIARLPLLGWTGLAPWGGLILLTLAATRFTVSVTNADGVSQSQKSVADAFIFLAAMMYAVGPAHTAGPAVVLAAIVGIISSWRSTDRRVMIFATSAAIISTFVAASLYGLIVDYFITPPTDGQGFSLNELLLPLCVLALVQYLLSTIATAGFIAIDSGKMKLTV